ncbi:hypothetical protein EV182_008409, partial [Spiromyces aspiralis]
AYIPPEPILDLSLFNNRTIPAVLIVSTTAGMVAFSLFYYVPIFFSAVFNASAVMAGVHLMPFETTNALAALILGQFMSRIGHMRLLTVIGFAITVVGTGLLTLLRPESGTGEQVGYLLLGGIGVGMVVPLTIVISQVAVKPQLMAVSATLLMFTRTIGGVFGLAISDAVFINALRPRLQTVGSRHPEYANTLMASQNDVSLIWDSGLPAD